MRKPDAQMIKSPTKLVCLAALLVVAAVGAVDLIRYLILGMAIPILFLCLTEAFFFLAAVLAWQSRFPAGLLMVAVPALLLGCTTNYLETTLFHLGFFLQAGAAFLSAVLGTVLAVRGRERPQRPSLPVLAFTALLLAGCLLTWGAGTLVNRCADTAGPACWAVPARYDAPCSQPGTVEMLSYRTKAYATDQREVEKNAWVYLPHGYDPSRQYNILYLMHGTGDNEASWLLEHPENKHMVDQLIQDGVIDPLIIVTPTFYVEDDCAGALDPLTYSFAQELRSDLMPAVESVYATFAERCDEQGFAASRDHRAFAGLSRGAVTTYHSAFCSSLDYFSWFGAFSGSRTDAEEFRRTIQSPALAAYPIHSLYVSSGVFDFALPGQIQDYRALLELEPRLKEGSNTRFDVFPMRYHSWQNWHLALYNFLQFTF